MTSRKEKTYRYQDQWLGHLFAKGTALGVNIIGLVMSIAYWKFGTEWDKLLCHAIFGTLPVHIMTILALIVATKYSREMSIVHDCISMLVCFIVSLTLYLFIEENEMLALFIFVTGSLLAFDFAIHHFTEK